MFGIYPVRTLLRLVCKESVLKPETDRHTSYITYWNGKFNTSKPKPNTFLASHGTWHVAMSTTVHSSTFVLSHNQFITQPHTSSCIHIWILSIQLSSLFPQVSWLRLRIHVSCLKRATYPIHLLSSVCLQNSDTPIASCIIILALL
jgi:hypothetical protein